MVKFLTKQVLYQVWSFPFLPLLFSTFPWEMKANIYSPKKWMVMDQRNALPQIWLSEPTILLGLLTRAWVKGHTEVLDGLKTALPRNRPFQQGGWPWKLHPGAVCSPASSQQSSIAFLALGEAPWTLLLLSLVNVVSFLSLWVCFLPPEGSVSIYRK